MDQSPTAEALALKINQLLTLSRGNRRERPTSNLNHAIQSLDGILLECQDFVEDLINNSNGESLATKYDYKVNQDDDTLIKPLESSTPCRKEEHSTDSKSPKIFLGAIQSLNFGMFTKTKSKSTRFSFDSIKNQINKIVYSYRIPPSPIEKELPQEPLLVVRQPPRSAHF